MTEHDAVQAAAAELALGLLSGPERADALAHLEGCAACRTAVEELADVADRLLLLAPEAEPPAGFETRVFARAAAPAIGRWRRRRPVLVAAAAVLLVVAVAGAVLVTRDRRGSRLDREYVAALEQLDGRALAAANLEDASGQRSGQLFLYEGANSWLFVTVDDPGAAGDLVVELRFKDGHRVLVPGLRLAAGRGSLGATVHLRLRDLERVRVLDTGGGTRYTVKRP
jgi:hypothetical protein